MGYTSYWRGNRCNEQDEKGYHLALPLIQKILERHKDIVCYEHDQPDRPPIADIQEIRFNGKGEDGHETFCFTSQTPKFAFCKTARKPYDIVVCECLLVLKACMPNLIMSSDGFSDNLPSDGEEPTLDGMWMLAIENVRNHFNIDYRVEITKQRPPYCDMEPIFQGFGSVAAHIDPPIGEESLCQNCGWQGPDSSLKTPIPDIFQRVDPGEEMPSGECPDCGALCHIVNRTKKTSMRITHNEDGYWLHIDAANGKKASFCLGSRGSIINEVLAEVAEENKEKVACGKL